MTGKQRSYLKGLANTLEAAIFIGKNDLTDNVLAQISEYLDVHELVKVKIQDGSMLEPKETANQCAALLQAEFVQAIGHRFVLYRPAKDPANRRIELPK